MDYTNGGQTTARAAWTHIGLTDMFCVALLAE